MKNKLALFGFLSFLGLLGLFTANRYFVSFFAYIVFFRYWNVIPDEQFEKYTEKSGARAFFAGIAVQTLSTLILAFFFNVNEAAVFASTLSSTTALIVFVFTLNHYENMEKRNLANED